VTVTVRNASRWPCPAFTILLPVGESTVAVPMAALRPAAARRVPRPLPTGRRGVLRIGPPTVWRRDPLGLVRRSWAVGASATLLVRPRVHPVAAPTAVRARHVEGSESSGDPTGGVAFHSLREYVPGDDLRQVHWRSSARLGTLLVVRRVDPGDPGTVVALDTRRGVYRPGAPGDEDFEVAVDVAASVLMTVVGAGFTAELRTPSRRSRATQGGRDAAVAMLDTLTMLTPRDTAETADAETAGPAVADLGLTDLVSVRGGGPATLVVVTGVASGAALSAAARAVSRFDTVIVVAVGAERDARAPVAARGAPALLAVPDAPAFVRAWNSHIRVSVGR